MTRISLVPLAAALLLAHPATSVGAEKTMTTSTGIELVWIPPGEFVMGSMSDEKDWALAKGAPEKQVKQEGDQAQKTALKQGFWLSRTEVTVGQWKQFVAATGYATDGEKKGESYAGSPRALTKGASWKDPKFGFKPKDNHPVSCISWNDAMAFCEWMTETEKKANKLAAGTVYRLPTEAEWEYACRAGSETKFWWGDTAEGGDRRLNWGGGADGFESISPVDHYGTRGRNRFGLADMLGNVQEWCLDDYDVNGAHADLLNTNSGGHVIRGGSFSTPPSVTRCASRVGGTPSQSHCLIGFRVCCGVPEGSGQSLGRAPTVAKTSTEKKTEEPSPRVAGAVDAESQKDAKKFARNQSSIKGLYVVRTDAGLRVGGSQDIIATAERAGSDRETICDFVTEVGKDTQISMEEAERLLKVRYPVWQAGYKIRFSYSNKYTKQAGGSAGGAFSVLLLSLLDGVQIDPAFAMTGDVTVDGKIREVGAVAEKIRGALLEKCRVIAIPEANKEDLSDLVVLYGPQMLWSVQLLSVKTLDDAAAVARADRAAELAKAIEIFGRLQRSLLANAMQFTPQNVGAIQTLREVLRLAPNHLSAEFMLRYANNQLPSTLSIAGSLDEIWAATGPMLAFLFADYKDVQKSKRYYFEKVPAATFKLSWERLNSVQFRLHAKTRDLRTAMADYMTSLDQMHRMSSFSAGALRIHLQKRDKVLTEAYKLGTDRKTLEEMMH